MKKTLICISICLIIVLMFSSCAAIGMNHLPEGELILSSDSPNGQYRIDAFLCNGGATTAFSVRCAVVETSTNKSRNIYWQYRQETAEIKWIDETNVNINGVELNVLTDSYDWRS